MLGNRGVRSKVVSVLALPVLVLLFGAGVVSAQALDSARAATRAGDLASSGSQFAAAISALQDERAMSAAVVRGGTVSPAGLTAARHASDGAVQELLAVLGRADVGSLSEQAGHAVVEAHKVPGRLNYLRAEIDTAGKGANPGASYARAAIADYDSVIASNVEFPSQIAASLTDRSAARRLEAYSDVIAAGEAVGRQQIAGLDLLSTTSPTTEARSALDEAIHGEQRSVAGFRDLATTSQSVALSKAAAGEEAAQLAKLLARLALETSTAAGASTSAPTATVDPQQWRQATDGRIAQYGSLGRTVAAQSATLSDAEVRQARIRAVTIVVVALLLVGLSLVVALLLARHVVQPLERLTAIAVRVEDELPAVVAKAANAKDRTSVRPPEIDVHGDDELGRLAEALRRVTGTALGIAFEQAALRAAISEMFVSVARRNQVLLSRQLAFIDQLERTEEDPDSLHNLFRLDHLATRMRRNAESLLVLAGADGGRRLRRPMPLSDVVRTATSEIEYYDRVVLELEVDPPLVAHVALPVAHLLAELIENATAFSDPGTTVEIHAEASSAGVRVSIIDHGIGMSGSELADANARIAVEAETDVLRSQRLGFFVVGRLARRLGAVVRLQQGRFGRGVEAVVDLPIPLFVTGSVVSVDGGQVATSPPAVVMPEGSGPGVPEELSAAERMVAAAAANTVSVSAHGPMPIVREPSSRTADPVADSVADSGADFVAESVGDPVAESVGDPVAGPVGDPVPDGAALPKRRRILPRRRSAPDDVVAEPVAQAAVEPMPEAAAEIWAQVAAQSIADAVAEPVAGPVAGPDAIPPTVHTVIEIDGVQTPEPPAQPPLGRRRARHRWSDETPKPDVATPSPTPEEPAPVEGARTPVEGAGPANVHELSAAAVTDGVVAEEAPVEPEAAQTAPVEDEPVPSPTAENDLLVLMPDTVAHLGGVDAAVDAGLDAVLDGGTSADFDLFADTLEVSATASERLAEDMPPSIPDDVARAFADAGSARDDILDMLSWEQLLGGDHLPDTWADDPTAGRRAPVDPVEPVEPVEATPEPEPEPTAEPEAVERPEAVEQPEAVEPAGRDSEPGPASLPHRKALFGGLRSRKEPDAPAAPAAPAESAAPSAADSVPDSAATPVQAFEPVQAPPERVVFPQADWATRPPVPPMPPAPETHSATPNVDILPTGTILPSRPSGRGFLGRKQRMRAGSHPASPAHPAPVPGPGQGSPQAAGSQQPARERPDPSAGRRPPAAPPYPVPAQPAASWQSTSRAEAGAEPEDERRRSALASEALSELSWLSTYTPAAVEPSSGPRLTKRMPAAPESAQPAVLPTISPQPPDGVAGRPRTATEVRSMLTGFHSGIARARSGAAAGGPGPVPVPFDATGGRGQYTTEAADPSVPTDWRNL